MKEFSNEHHLIFPVMTYYYCEYFNGFSYISLMAHIKMADFDFPFSCFCHTAQPISMFCFFLSFEFPISQPNCIFTVFMKECHRHHYHQSIVSRIINKFIFHAVNVLKGLSSWFTYAYIITWFVIVFIMILFNF